MPPCAIVLPGVVAGFTLMKANGGREALYQFQFACCLMHIQYPEPATFIDFTCTCMCSMIQMRLLFRSRDRTVSLVFVNYYNLLFLLSSWQLM